MRSDQLVERSHWAHVTMDRGFAKLRVRRTVFNGGPQFDQATFVIFPPLESVAVGLRTAGTRQGQTIWYVGELMEAEAAARKYRELTGFDAHQEPKDPALLSWLNDAALALQVFPCPPSQTKTVEYTLLAPTYYEKGAHHFRLQRTGTSDLPASASFVQGNPRDTLMLNGKPLDPGRSIQPTSDFDVAIVPNGAPTLDGALGVKPTGGGQVLTSYRLHAAPKLSEVPSNPRIVVILDQSHSMARLQAEQRSAAKAYLSQFSTGLVQVLSFNRSVKQLTQGFVSLPLARYAIDHATAFANGSHADGAFTKASQLLAPLSKELPKRVVLFTDDLMRASLQPEHIKQAVEHSGAVVHVAVVQEGKPNLVRRDDHAWADPLRTTGGLVWDASADPDGIREMRTVYEELARPMRFDHVVVETSQKHIGFQDVGVLSEGEGVSHFNFETDQVSWVRLTGELWSTPFSKTFKPDENESRRAAALVFGSHLLHTLTEPEMSVLALYGGAVSPVTSYLAIEPGVRPSREGIQWDAFGEGSGAGGMGYGVGLGSVGPLVGSNFDGKAYLQSVLATAWKNCGGQPNSATVDLQTTLDEIVDVDSVSTSDPDKAKCLEQATWNLRLPQQFLWIHSTWRVQL